MKHPIGVAGVMTAFIRAPDLSRARIQGVEWVRRESGLYVVRRKNAFVNRGLRVALDLSFNIGAASAISHMAVSGDSSTVTANTSTMGTPNAAKVFDSTPVRVNQTVTSLASFDEGDVSFDMRKIGLLNGSDPTADVVDIIGGTGGSAPYDKDLTLNLTNVSEWDITFQIDVTMTAI